MKVRSSSSEPNADTSFLFRNNIKNNPFYAFYIFLSCSLTNKVQYPITLYVENWEKQLLYFKSTIVKLLLCDFTKLFPVSESHP